MRLRNLPALMSNAAAKSAHVYAPRGSRTIARAGREQVPKTLALADGLGSLVRLARVLGQRGEITGAEKPIEGLSPGALLADKAYVAEPFRDMLKSKGIEPVIPQGNGASVRLPAAPRCTNGGIRSRISFKSSKSSKGSP